MKTTLNRKINKKYQRKTMRKTMRKTIRTRRNKYEQNGGFTFLSGYYAFFCNSKVAEQLEYSHNGEAPKLDTINNLLGLKAYSLKLFTKDRLRKTQGQKLHMVIPPRSVASQMDEWFKNIYSSFLKELNDLDSNPLGEVAWYVTYEIGKFLLILLGFAAVVAAVAAAVPLRIVVFFIPGVHVDKIVEAIDEWAEKGWYQGGGTVVEPKNPQDDTITPNSDHDEPANPNEMVLNLPVIINLLNDDSTIPIHGLTELKYIKYTDKFDGLTSPNSNEPDSKLENSSNPHIIDMSKNDIDVKIDMSKNDIDVKIDVFLYKILLMLNRTNLISHNSNTTESISETIKSYNNANRIDCCIIIKINKFKRNKFIRKYNIINIV